MASQLSSPPPALALGEAVSSAAAYAASVAELDEFLAAHGRCRRRVASDGACLFRTFSEHLYGTVVYHHQVRARCVSHLREHENEYSLFVAGGTTQWALYLHDMSKAATWGDQVALAALLSVYNLRATVVRAGPPSPRVEPDNDLAITAAEPVREALAREQVPASYAKNSDKEELVLAFVANFDRQFRYLYGQRSPLFLVRPNEYGVEKFVSTTVRPTSLPFKELYNHDGASSFVADYVAYRQLSNPLKPPETLASPTSVLWTQSGTAFDQAVLLCSLLEGVGYDAYV
eukprot:UC1_evm1s157